VPSSGAVERISQRADTNDERHRGAPDDQREQQWKLEQEKYARHHGA
jgi:hypothetical protein